MFVIKYDETFKRDYKRMMRRYPHLKDEFRAAVLELAESGTLSDHYHPHELANPGGNYNGHVDFHLSSGRWTL